MVLDEPVATEDESGSEVIAWVPRMTVWCSIEPLTGREALNANQMLATIDTKIVMRWSPSVDAVVATWRGQQVNRQGDRAGPLYDFQSVAHVAFRRQEVDVLARAGAASA